LKYFLIIYSSPARSIRNIDKIKLLQRMSEVTLERLGYRDRQKGPVGNCVNRHQKKPSKIDSAIVRLSSWLTSTPKPIQRSHLQLDIMLCSTNDIESWVLNKLNNKTCRERSAERRAFRASPLLYTNREYSSGITPCRIFQRARGSGNDDSVRMPKPCCGNILDSGAKLRSSRIIVFSNRFRAFDGGPVLTSDSRVMPNTRWLCSSAKVITTCCPHEKDLSSNTIRWALLFEMILFLNFQLRFILLKWKSLPTNLVILGTNLKSWTKTSQTPSCHEVLSAIIPVPYWLTRAQDICRHWRRKTFEGGVWTLKSASEWIKIKKRTANLRYAPGGNRSQMIINPENRGPYTIRFPSSWLRRYTPSCCEDIEIYLREKHPFAIHTQLIRTQLGNEEEKKTHWGRTLLVDSNPRLPHSLLQGNEQNRMLYAEPQQLADHWITLLIPHFMVTLCVLLWNNNEWM
jgi:hypothetical protein